MYNFNIKHIIIVLACLFFVCNNSYAQQTTTTYSEDTVSAGVNEYDQLYSLILSDKERIYTLIKFNAVDWGQLKPSVIVEQNMGGNFNFEPKIILKAFDWSFSEGMHYAIETRVDFKYYYNYKRRNKLGKKTNGFSGNYFSLGGSGTMSDYTKYMETQMLNHNISFEDVPQKNFYQVWTAEAAYGLQRRLGAIGYIDIKAGVQYINYVDYGENLLPFLKVGIGFGLTKDKALDLIR